MSSQRHKRGDQAAATQPTSVVGDGLQPMESAGGDVTVTVTMIAWWAAQLGSPSGSHSDRCFRAWKAASSRWGGRDGVSKSTSIRVAERLRQAPYVSVT
jgi:hypothetical protein